MTQPEEDPAGAAFAKGGLTEREVAQVREVADAVRDSEGLELKLDWEMMAAPGSPDAMSNFCYGVAGHLVGYAQLDADGADLEMTAAVLPAFRRRGIFRALLDLTRQEARRRGAKRLLLVSYRASLSGGAAVRALGLPYLYSEYRMEAESGAMGTLPAGAIRLVTVEAGDIGQVRELAHLMAVTWGSEQRSPEALARALEHPEVRYFLAERDGAPIGHIGVIAGEDGIYVRAVGIVPEQRRRGYGRELLAATLRTMLAEGHTRFALDVATENVQALSLYEACGFHATNIYDYHEVTLEEQGIEP